MWFYLSLILSHVVLLGVGLAIGSYAGVTDTENRWKEAADRGIAPPVESK